MKARRRFIETLLFNQPDKIPLYPGSPRESTIQTWHTQGLPEEADWHDTLCNLLSIPKGVLYKFPEVDICCSMLPAFEEYILEHRNGHYILQDSSGAIVEISDQYDFSYLREAKDFVTRSWHRFPVESPQDWEEKIRWRYDPAAPKRLPADFVEQVRTIQEKDQIWLWDINGPFWQMREWCGFNGLCYMMADHPDFIDEMANYWKDYMLALFERILSLAIPDCVVVSEDMAYKLHSMISPKMVQRFLLPVWKTWIKVIKSSGCPVVMIDSDGYIGELIPQWIEAGFDGTYPIEVAAGNDIVALSKKYDRQFAFYGGIDKRTLAKGGVEMLAELDRIAPVIRNGGYFPSCDHAVPPDISWINFIEYTQRLAELTGWK